MRQALNTLFKDTLALSTSWCAVSICGHAAVVQTQCTIRYNKSMGRFAGKLTSGSGY